MFIIYFVFFLIKLEKTKKNKFLLIFHALIENLCENIYLFITQKIKMNNSLRVIKQVYNLASFGYKNYFINLSNNSKLNVNNNFHFIFILFSHFIETINKFIDFLF